jgi:hypothetical protein
MFGQTYAVSMRVFPFSYYNIWKNAVETAKLELPFYGSF